MNKDERPIIIKKVKKSSEGHHGGAWKIAYADFVTAMMAFFLLLWLVSATTEEQRLGIADYFAPTVASESLSGAGAVLSGRSVSEDGAQSSGSVMVSIPNTPPQMTKPDKSTGEAKTKSAESEMADKLVAEQEQALFLEAEQELRDAFASRPDLKDLADHIVIDQTPEGLRIQIVDREGQSSFRVGSAELTPAGRRLIKAVARVIGRLPNRISVFGHTDANPFRGANGESNWELSAERANASRRVLLANGLSEDRIFQVTGKAATEPLLPDNPYRPANRRITILLMREAPVLPPDADE